MCKRIYRHESKLQFYIIFTLLYLRRNIQRNPTELFNRTLNQSKKMTSPFHIIVMHNDKDT